MATPTNTMPKTVNHPPAKLHAMQQHRDLLLEDATLRFSGGVGAKDLPALKAEKQEIMGRDLSHLFDDEGRLLNEAGKKVEINPLVIEQTLEKSRQVEEAVAKGVAKPSWKTNLAERIEKNLKSESTSQQIFTHAAIWIGAFTMVDGVINLLSSHKKSYVPEGDNLIANPDNASLRQALARLAVGASIITAGLLVNVSSKGHSRL